MKLPLGLSRDVQNVEEVWDVLVRNLDLSPGRGHMHR
jgi:hypothetical protein